MRKHYLDNIRWVTVVLVVIYHVLYMYNGEGVQGGLEELMKGRTVIIVAHNYSAIKGADQIIVMNNGKVEACGNEEELKKGNKYYRQFASEQ